MKTQLFHYNTMILGPLIDIFDVKWNMNMNSKIREIDIPLFLFEISIIHQHYYHCVQRTHSSAALLFQYEFCTTIHLFPQFQHCMILKLEDKIDLGPLTEDSI